MKDNRRADEVIQQLNDEWYRRTGKERLDLRPEPEGMVVVDLERIPDNDGEIAA